ncbi:O-methyltransferase [Bacillus horti]|uniref:tRNA 5-hydroxyuridine methyltransferase n=1 Tax=Caldalkalibacillus horti TaxID=77523 RepID=A0ABT9VT99_9BACI|nr:O-methyltransferase [Bacillus horti]MDQ0164214.1 putative O-methyltransferase YrrM [Bacillus horti]
MIHADLENYLLELSPLKDELLVEMEKLAADDHVPIIDRPSISFIQQLLTIKGNVRRILELGTAIGYSAIWLAEGAKSAIIDTIERDELRVEQAKQFITRAGLDSRVHIHVADATDYAEQLKDHKYDIIFIDAAKGQYQRFFESYTPLLAEDGVVLTDNVFFHGEVVNPDIQNKRIRTLVEKIKRYNVWLREHDSFKTSFVPIGDGLAISVRRREE